MIDRLHKYLIVTFKELRKMLPGVALVQSSVPHSFDITVTISLMP
jgi:hypothetical protein